MRVRTMTRSPWRLRVDVAPWSWWRHLRRATRPSSPPPCLATGSRSARRCSSPSSSPSRCIRWTRSPSPPAPTTPLRCTASRRRRRLLCPAPPLRGPPLTRPLQPSVRLVSSLPRRLARPRFASPTPVPRPSPSPLSCVCQRLLALAPSWCRQTSRLPRRGACVGPCWSRRDQSEARRTCAPASTSASTSSCSTETAGCSTRPSLTSAPSPSTRAALRWPKAVACCASRRRRRAPRSPSPTTLASAPNSCCTSGSRSRPASPPSCFPPPRPRLTLALPVAVVSTPTACWTNVSLPSRTPAASSHTRWGRPPSSSPTRTTPPTSRTSRLPLSTHRPRR
mmetsp:Transcript_6089/g.19870  ORF Transcript_6089/g.19870 Transcript_6089/m.19870 type:complete len:337 (-) Transcript_6089:86-1096(-)